MISRSEPGLRLAIADSDVASADLLTFLAEQRGHRTLTVRGIHELFHPLPFVPSVVVLSLDEFDDSSLTSISALREEFPGLTVIVTSETGGMNASCAVLEAGAHDFVRRPYNPREVILRAERWTSVRADIATEGDRTVVGDLVVDLGRYLGLKNGVVLQLTKLELRLLYCLCEHHPHVASTERLLTFGWEHSDDAEPALIKTHISHIRKKLREAGGESIEIRSRQSVGYELRLGSE